MVLCAGHKHGGANRSSTVHDMVAGRTDHLLKLSSDHHGRSHGHGGKHHYKQYASCALIVQVDLKEGSRNDLVMNTERKPKGTEAEGRRQAPTSRSALVVHLLCKLIH